MDDLKQLVPIHEYKQGTPFRKCVSARKLHNFLQNKRQFANWIKERVSKYGFVENQDFVTFNKIVKRAKRIEYAITLDMAKELAMVENNERGRQARRYFIECEKELQKMRIPTQLEQQRLILQLLEEREANKEKIEYHDQVLDTSNGIITTVIAKELGMSARALNAYLKDMGYQYKKGGVWHLTRKYQNRGYAHIRTTVIMEGTPQERTTHSLVWTEKGRKVILSVVRSSMSRRGC